MDPNRLKELGLLPVWRVRPGAIAGQSPDSGKNRPDQIETAAESRSSEESEDRLTSIADKFKANQKLSSTDIQFINLTNLPIYKALAVTTAKANKANAFDNDGLLFQVDATLRRILFISRVVIAAHIE